MTCKVCGEAMSHDNLTTPCGHTFCAACIKPVLEAEPKCPTCGAKATVDRLTDAAIIYTRISFSGLDPSFFPSNCLPKVILTRRSKKPPKINPKLSLK